MHRPFRSLRFTLPLVALGALTLSAAPAHAQGFPQVGATFAVGVPQGAFADNLDHSLSFGLSAHGLYHFGAAPLALGLEGTFQTYGTETRNVPISLTIPDVTVDVTTTNNIAQLFGVLRLQPATGVVRPYAEGLVGLSYLFTETRIDDEDTPGRDDIASSTNFDDVAFASGLGGGVLIPVFNTVNKDGRFVEVMLDLHVRYLFGGEAEYLDRGDITRNTDGTIGVRPRQSRTDQLLPQIGVSVRF